MADVKTDSWQYAPAMYVYRRGIMTGKGKNAQGAIIFDPEAKLTRQELAQMLYSAEGKAAVVYSETFTDVQKGKWYTNAVLWAADKGIVSGYPNGEFGVDDEITREQLAAMLYKYAEYKEYDITARAEFTKFTDVNRISGWAVEKIQWAVANGVMSGKGERIDPAGSATRAECAAMLRSFMVKFEEGE